MKALMDPKHTSLRASAPPPPAASAVALPAPPPAASAPSKYGGSGLRLEGFRV